MRGSCNLKCGGFAAIGRGSRLSDCRAVGEGTGGPRSVTHTTEKQGGQTLASSSQARVASKRSGQAPWRLCRCRLPEHTIGHDLDHPRLDAPGAFKRCQQVECDEDPGPGCSPCKGTGCERSTGQRLFANSWPARPAARSIPTAYSKQVERSLGGTQTRLWIFNLC